MQLALLAPLLLCALIGAQLGPHWMVEKLPRFPEAGPAPRNLVRVEGGRRVVVDQLVRSYRFYEPDCVVYETGRTGGDVFAVCGNRTPIGVASVGEWQFADDGLRRGRKTELQDGRAVQVVELFPLPDIVALPSRRLAL